MCRRGTCVSVCVKVAITTKAQNLFNIFSCSFNTQFIQQHDVCIQSCHADDFQKIKILKLQK